jgi:fermentation-respiration switch protein FrsA (DUF1100 family)
MRLLTTLCALLALTIGVLQLERERVDIPRTNTFVGSTPVSVYGTGPGPAVVIAHGFAGSRQLMEGYALTLRTGRILCRQFRF